jgi:predicted nucleic acid-binding protein
MILIDTNVLSELMRPEPNQRVVQWLDAQPEWDIWISAITVAEIRLGISLLPNGKRKRSLEDLSEEMFQEDFTDRCLPFDYEVSFEYTKIVVERNQQGLPISIEDAQIAAIAKTGELTLATRNTKDFSHITGLNVINPWDV